MWVNRIWPFSVLHRIERKVDHMSSVSEKLKAALDSIAGHVTGIKSGVESLQANLKAALDAAAANNQKSDPLLDAALSEANDLNEKLGALESALAPHVDVPQTPSPAPAESPPVNQPKDPATREAVDAAIAALPGDYTDPDYVVNGMRAAYGDLFTADDEAKVRELVKPAS